MKLIKQVLAYNKANGLGYQHNPKLLNTRHGVFSQMALQTEIDNINAAFYSHSIENVAMAISDAIYKLTSVACELGLQNQLEKCLDEILLIHMEKIKNDNRLNENVQQIVCSPQTESNRQINLLSATSDTYKCG